MNGEMPNTWKLECSGRVLGAKSGKAVDTLLRLHKKKCEICRNIQYLCVDQGVLPLIDSHKKNAVVKRKATTDYNRGKLKEFIDALEAV